MSAAPPASTRTDLAALDRIIDAQRDVVELESDLLEDDVDTRGATQAFRRDAIAAAPTHVPVPIQTPFAAPAQMHGHVMPVQATPKPQTVIPDPRKIVAQQKEMARQQEAARQAEIARAQEYARQQEAAHQAEIARQQEMARQAEIARQQEIVRQQEAARQEQIAREFERQEQELAQQRIEREKQDLARQHQELARQKEELARQQELARQAQELALQQQEIARQKEELARQQDFARQQAILRQQTLARQAEELERAKQLAAKAEAAKLAAEIDAAAQQAVVTPRDADPMSASQMKAATLNAPPVEDLSATVQGVPSPMIPDAPQTSPVLDPSDKISTQPTAKTLQSAQQRPMEGVKISTAADAEEAKHFTQPFRRPSSIAPVAIDILPARTGTQQSPVATMQIQRMDARRADTVLTRMPPKENHTPWIIAACVAGVFLLGGGITAAVALAASSSAPAAAAAADDDGNGSRNARTPESSNAKSAPPVAPSIGSHGEKVPQPSNEPVSVNNLPTAGGSPAKKHDSSSSSPSSPSNNSHASTTPSSGSTPNSKVLVPATPAAAPAPAAAPSPAPSPSVASNNASPPATPSAPKAAAPATGNGTIQVKPPLVVIVVDGQHKRAVNGEVVVTCGSHKVRAGMDTQVVNVPCGGSVAL